MENRLGCDSKGIRWFVVLLLVIMAMPVAAIVPGDVAPHGNPDGQLDAGDLQLQQQFVAGLRVPDAADLLAGDLTPPGFPDGVIDVSDYLLLQQAVLGLISLDSPVALAAPQLWAAAGVSERDTGLVTGLARPGSRVQIYRDGILQGSSLADQNGLYRYSVNLLAGVAHSITATTLQNGTESDHSLPVDLLYLARPAAPDLARIAITADTHGIAIAGQPGSVLPGVLVTIHMTDGSDDVVLADPSGGFSFSANAQRQVAFITVTTADGMVSDPAVITAVGTVAGTFNVDSSGAANYSIAVTVPPGTAGMVPALSLRYSSNGGNGLLGQGWSLEGLSEIARCAQTVAQDGQPGGVNLDANDRFCLDGQRLVSINGGSYGAPGTEYRTEIETFTRVISHGGTGDTPDYFTARTRAGQIIEYGRTPDSQFNPDHGATLRWAVSRVADRQGNYYRIRYQEDLVNNEHFPLRIEYTANDGPQHDGSQALLASYNTVLFDYEVRPDRHQGYIGGHRLSASVRLRHIRSYAGNALAREYRLAYDASPASGASRLRAVTECGGGSSGNPVPACLQPVTFTWQEGAPSLGALADTGVPAGSAAETLPLDVDGDGRSDLVMPDGSKWKYYRNNGNGFDSAVSIQAGNDGHKYALPVDYDGNGLIDLLLPNGVTGTWHALLSDGTTLAELDTGIPRDGYRDNPQVMDVNGDGLQDLVYARNDGGSYYWKVRFNSTAGFGVEIDGPAAGRATGQLDSAGQCIPATEELSPAVNLARQLDYDNDGRMDLLWVRSFGPVIARGSGHNNTCSQAFAPHWSVLLSTGTTLRVVDTTALIPADFAWENSRDSSRNLVTSDINGDGLQDVLYPAGNTVSGYEWVMHLGTGGGLTDGVLAGVHSTDLSIPAQVTDLNTDGRSDLVLSGNGILACHLSLGDTLNGTEDAGYAVQYNVPGMVLDVNADGLPDLIVPSGAGWQTRLNPGVPGDRIVSIVRGRGDSSDVVYRPLTDRAVYTRGDAADAARAERDYQAPVYVVSQAGRSDGTGGRYLTEYHYSAMVVQLQGRGMLGFRSVTADDPQTGIVTTSVYRQDFPFTGMLESSSTGLHGHVVARVDNSLDSHALSGGAVHFPFVSQSVERNYDLQNSGSLLNTRTVTTAYDSLGNAYANRVETVDAAGTSFSTDTQHTFDPPDLNVWVLDRVVRSQTVHHAPGVPDVVRTSAFAYYPPGDVAQYLLQTELIEPDAGNTSPLYLRTDYEYDAFGNRQKVTVTGRPGFDASVPLESRETVTQYDSSGQFPEWTRNALGHTESYDYDPRLGGKIRQTGPNGLATTWVFDDFGRKLQESRADGNETRWQFDFCTSADCPHGGYIETVYVSGSAATRTWYDSLQREIRSETGSLTGEIVRSDVEYTMRGNILRKSRPYLSRIQAPQWTTFDYDELDRPVHELAPDGGEVSYAYADLARNTRRWHPAGDYDQTDTRISDVMGQLVSVVDAMNGSRFYRYDAAGNLTSTSDSAGNTTTAGFDLRGRKTSMTDPDMGSWEYRYNGFGELVWQRDGNNQIVTMQYDKLGRMLSRHEPDGDSGWTYDRAGNGIGKLESVTYTSAGQTHTRQYDFDALGRLVTEISVLDGRTLALGYSYDTFGRLETVTYPTGFMVRNVYSDSGLLAEVRAADQAAADRFFWRAGETDAEGHVTLESLGNGLQTVRQYDAASGLPQSISTGAGTGSSVQSLSYGFDSLGNLRYRSDSRQNLAETFDYDSLNRLRTVTLAGIGSRQYSYDALGNIRSKPDHAGSYIYGGGNAGPHAVTEVRNGTTLLNRYTYDDNGNMTGGDGRTIHWTSFNKARSIERGADRLEFFYDADHNRVKQVHGNSMIYYLRPGSNPGVEYEEEVTGSQFESRHYIYAGGRAIAVYTQLGTGAAKIRYLHADHLGSTDVVSDETGAVVERMSFAAFGDRRDPDWRSAAGVLAGLETRHGFTGHEQLDAVGLIHMNGRLYDPKLGRFLSPDIQIQYPDQTQSFNRYTYVNNNPLSYTDPTGYGFLSKLWKKVRKLVAAVVVVAAAVAGFAWGVVYTMSITGAITTAVTIAAFTYGAMTGGLKGALSAALMAYSVSGALLGLPGMVKGVASGLRSVMETAARSVSEAVEHVVKWAGHHYAQLKTRQEMARFAKRNGLSLFELNMGLGFVSWSGNTFFGYDRLRLGGDESFGAAASEPGISGIFENGVNGSIFDLADTALTLQGFPTAQGLSLVAQCGGRVTGSCLGSNYQGTLYGHSLGAAEIANLKGLGLIDKSVGLQVFSLPFSQIAPAGVAVSQGGRDLVNLGVFGHLTNPGSKLLDQGGSSLIDAFTFRTHSCNEAYQGCGF